MVENNSIVFLHLSDFHFNKEDDIDDNRIIKIVDSLKTYKNIHINGIIIIISGDLTCSGTKYQFKTVWHFMGSLIIKLKDNFNCICNIITVPGNHDVNHDEKPLDLDYLKNQKYNEVEDCEFKKLSSFYNYAKRNKCFIKNEKYQSVKIIEIEGFKIKVNLINNAIFSTLDSYKGMLYIPDHDINELNKNTDSDLIITIMHHAPDFYRDDIKNRFEDTIVKNSDILFHGHEHYNYSKQTSFNGAEYTVVQSGGCLCNNGDWNDSSFIIGIFDTKEYKYEYFRYSWNNISKQYEHGERKLALIKKPISTLPITEDFLDFISVEKEKYFVFPSIIYHGNKPTEDFAIERFDDFKEELQKHQYSIIVGMNNIGKTTLLKHIFTSFVKDYFVIYASTDKLLEKSTRKKQNIDKLIKSLFEDIYGFENSDWQKFEQSDPSRCIFILDDFEQIDGINTRDLFRSLSGRFGIIIISNIHTIDFDPLNINIEDKETIARFEIKAPVGHKRREIIKAVVSDKASDKSESNINTIVNQVDSIIKTQLNIIPPEPYFIIQMAENFMNNVGEAIYKNTNAFSKVFEANIINKIDAALQNFKSKKTITVDLMYVLLTRIAYFIHFNKAYPIKRNDIDRIITEYNTDYGKALVTEDIIKIAKSARIITDTEESSEEYRFKNKSILAYFVAKEIISRKDVEGLNDVINKACINICTDILLFIIYLSDNTSILHSIVESINRTIKSDSSWSEFSIPDSVPNFIKNNNQLPTYYEQVNKTLEKNQIDKSEETAEEYMLKSFTIKDIYDWDDSAIDDLNNRLIRMTSLLQILAKCLPCFEHILKKDEKQELISLLYTVPNRIFMFWSESVEKNYEDIIAELKTHPYITSKKNKMRESDVDIKVKSSFALYAMNLLLNLYYIPVLNATGMNTLEFLNNAEFFNYDIKLTYQLEHLMFVEQIPYSNNFVNSAINMQKKTDDNVFSYLLQCIVRHGLITRSDTKENINRLESKFFPKAKKPILIERAKNGYSKK